MRRSGIAGVLLIGVALAGCRPQAGAVSPTPAPTPVVTPSPPAYRVATVDLGALIRAHRRWPEFEALTKRISTLEIQLMSPPAPPESPRQAASPDLQAEADRLSAALHAEIGELREQLQRRIDAYGRDLQAEHEAKAADRQRELNAGLSKALEARRDELQRDLERFELATMAEYRVPLANLRVKADVVGITSEEEAAKIQAEGERIAKERDEKVRAHAQGLEKQMQEFTQAKTAEAEATFNAYIAALEAEAREMLAAKNQEAEAELKAAIRVREQTFQQSMEERRKLAVEGVETQLRAAQERYIRQWEAERVRMRAELQDVTAQRIRLEDSMLAEIKIEVATVAQERRVDAVLTQTLVHPGAVDLTPEVIERLRRS